VVAQSNFHRLTTPHGGLIDDPNYGLDLNGFLEKGIALSNISDVPSQIQAELLKDDRNETVSVTMSVPKPNVLNFKIVTTLADGPFTMTVGVDSTGTFLQEVTKS
jgi:hypothetical protein